MRNAYRKLPGDERRRTRHREYIFELRTKPDLFLRIPK